MKTLAIQLQPDILAADTCKAAIRILRGLQKDKSLVSSAKFIHGRKQERRYINVEFSSSDMPKLWKVARKRFFSDDSEVAGLDRGVIVVCQGNFDWNDYLLLYHYDPEVQLDKLEPA
ncbi:MAG: hypothetical protein LBS49_07370 [Candidatus Accumulibacter sp.]|jgi:hypothetical protein|nr:hypothetical protein [Accumulibacter sp.]